jgi:hypothetical protein
MNASFCSLASATARWKRVRGKTARRLNANFKKSRSFRKLI